MIRASFPQYALLLTFTPSGRSQASPVTAWLRVPLDYYHSSTFAYYPDESHSTIKRSFHTPAPRPGHAPTRRQFCGYCGTHLTSWNEGHPSGGDSTADYIDVTLGSLLDESLNKLEQLKLYTDLDSESESGLVKDDEAQVDNDTHIPTTEPPARTSGRSRGVGLHRMQGRGIPYFEEMVENSRLGRIKRQRGGQTSADGRATVQWEVIEIGGEDEPMADPGVSVETGNGNKRLRMEG